jgi:hypothetical protein
MGTIGDWSLILAMSITVGLYGCARTMDAKTIKLGRSFAGWCLLSRAVFIEEIFRSEAFLLPLVFITVPAAVAGVALIYFARARGGQQSAAHPSVDNDK